MIVRCKKCKKQYERFDIGSYGTPNLCPKCSKLFINLLIILVLGMFLIPLTSATQIFKGGDPVDVKIQCMENGTYCPGIASCNITLNYPNNSILTNNRPMTNQYSFFNYTLNDSSILGAYPCSVICCDNGLCGNNQDCSFEITYDGVVISPVRISVYLFFLLLCLVLTFFSFRLTQKNPASKDTMEGQALYEFKKRNEFAFYLKLLRQKMWIIGVFGIYISLLIFIAIMAQLTSGLGLLSLNAFFINASLLFFWGLIPFMIFWVAYTIIFLSKSTEDILKWQYGRIKQ